MAFINLKAFNNALKSIILINYFYNKNNTVGVEYELYIFEVVSD